MTIFGWEWKNKQQQKQNAGPSTAGLTMTP
jgi:hypothetical protein